MGLLVRALALLAAPGALALLAAQEPAALPDALSLVQRSTLAAVVPHTTQQSHHKRRSVAAAAARLSERARRSGSRDDPVAARLARSAPEQTEEELAKEDVTRAALTQAVQWTSKKIGLPEFVRQHVTGLVVVPFLMKFRLALKPQMRLLVDNLAAIEVMDLNMTDLNSVYSKVDEVKAALNASGLHRVAHIVGNSASTSRVASLTVKHYSKQGVSFHSTSKLLRKLATTSDMAAVPQVSALLSGVAELFEWRALGGRWANVDSIVLARAASAPQLSSDAMALADMAFLVDDVLHFNFRHRRSIEAALRDAAGVLHDISDLTQPNTGPLKPERMTLPGYIAYLMTDVADMIREPSKNTLQGVVAKTGARTSQLGVLDKSLLSKIFRIIDATVGFVREDAGNVLKVVDDASDLGSLFLCSIEGALEVRPGCAPFLLSQKAALSNSTPPAGAALHREAPRQNFSAVQLAAVAPGSSGEEAPDAEGGEEAEEEDGAAGSDDDEDEGEAEDDGKDEDKDEENEEDDGKDEEEEDGKEEDDDDGKEEDDGKEDDDGKEEDDGEAQDDEDGK